MSEWISVKDELPPKNILVWISSSLTGGVEAIDSVSKVKDMEENKEKVVFCKGRWEYITGIFAYDLTRWDMWRKIEQ